jgi:membrane protease YdiL (CAAX protease family)
MERNETTIMALLFILASLGFPMLTAGDRPPEQQGEEAPFLVHAGYLELKLDAAAATVVPEADTDDDVAQPLQLFDADYWLSSTDEMPAEPRRELLSKLVVVCLATGRDKAAAKLDRGAELTTTGAPLVALLQAPDIDRKAIEVELSSHQQQPWITGLIKARYIDGDGAPPSPETLQLALGQWMGQVGLFMGLMLVLFVAGVLLLGLSSRVLSRYRHPDSIFTKGMFGASPMHTFLLFAAWFALSHALSFLVVQFLSGQLPQPQMLLVAYLISSIAGVILVSWRGQLRSNSLAQAVDLEVTSITRPNMTLGLLAYVAAIPCVFMLSLLSGVLLGGGEEGLNPAIPLLVESGGSLNYWILVGNVVILAPLFEEFFFRGFLFQQFRRFLSLPNAILLSALVFASVHLSIESFLPLFGLGILLAGVYHYTRCLWASMLTHALWNLGTIIAVSILFG